MLLGLEVKSKLTIRAARIKGGKKIDLSVSVDEEFVFFMSYFDDSTLNRRVSI